MVKYRFLTALFLVVGLIVAGLGLGSGYAAQVQRISKEQLKAEMGKKDLVIIDVRIEPDWQSSQFKIPGAVREDPANVEGWMSKYHKDQKLVLYCA